VTSALAELFTRYENTLAAMQLVLAMLGMGATLRVGDFREISSRPNALTIVLVAQYLVFPIVAVAIARLLSLPAGIALGLLVLAIMPSGALSNLFTFLGQGNLALSITSTLASMLTCLLVTPLLLQWLGSAALPADFRMPTQDVVNDIVMFLLLPLAGGMIVRRFSNRWHVQFSQWMVRSSMLVLALIVVGSLGTDRIEVLGYGLLTPAVLVLFCMIQFLVIRGLTIRLRYPSAESYTLAIEVSIRNGNLAILLSSTLYHVDSPSAQAMGAGTLYVALFYGAASLILAFVSITLRRRRAARRALQGGAPTVEETS
jgi:BASS family bile acid:Na+ symporter